MTGRRSLRISWRRWSSIRPPAHIDPGAIRGDFYENPSIGFSYRIPQGWTLEANGAVQPAVERYRERQDFGRPRVGRAEHRLMDACSRTLFSVWAKRPDASGQISYDDFGEVTVSAISLACFPRMKFPADSSDQKSAKDFLLQFGLTHPIIDDMRDAKEFTAGGNVFLYLHGTVGFLLPNDALARRLSIAMAVTQRRGYLLTWFFAAPHDQELQALTDERVLFDNAPPVTVVSATKPGAAKPASPAAVATANTPTGATSGAAAASVPSSANSGASAIPSAAANAANGPTANPPATAASSPVTQRAGFSCVANAIRRRHQLSLPQILPAPHRQADAASGVVIEFRRRSIGRRRADAGRPSFPAPSRRNRPAKQRHADSEEKLIAID